MSIRTNTAKWDDKRQHWVITVQKDGKRKWFYSPIKGRTGQREANKKADEWLDCGIDYNTTFEKLYKKWLDIVKATTSESNYNDREKHGRIWILPAVGHKKMQNLTEQDFQNILDAAYIAGKAEKTIKNIKGTIITFMKFARKSKATTLTLEFLTVAKGAPKPQREILLISDIKKLFEPEQKPYWYLNAFRFIFLTGMREGELIRLKKSDIHDGKCHILKGKTENAKRSFILTPEMKLVIQEQLEQIECFDNDILFPSIRGMLTPRTSLYNQWKRYQEHNNFNNSISIHEIRHTLISYSKEIPLELLKSQVGHSNTMDTFGQYGHKTENDYNELAEHLSANFQKLFF